jgi:hypothetical protein
MMRLKEDAGLPQIQYSSKTEGAKLESTWITVH